MKLILLNERMNTALASIRMQDLKLPIELEAMVSHGFIKRDGCVLLTELASRDTNVSLVDFQDKTGYECFINSLHVEDYVEVCHLSYACLFVNTLLRAWRASYPDDHARIILSSDELSTVVRLHVLRDQESWVDGDLERYEEAILVVDSSVPALN